MNDKYKFRNGVWLLVTMIALSACGGGGGSSSSSNSTSTNTTSTTGTDTEGSDSNSTDTEGSDSNSTDTEGSDSNSTDTGGSDSNSTDTGGSDSNSSNTDTNTTGTTNQKGYSLLAWNDLGMHCMDSDYSVFSILPPYNNVNAQLVKNGNVVTSGVSLSYESTADPSGSINTSSIGKTNFWKHSKNLFGVDLAENEGLAGFKVASTRPQQMRFNQQQKWFEAVGIPRIPIDDNGKSNAYPMMKITAHDPSGNELATAKIVTPVSSEMNCASCHASTTDMTFSVEAEPQGGWVNDPNPEKDFRRNILRLHDERHLGNGTYAKALQTKGYDTNGLLATADSGKAVLCAGCHSSNALPGTGIVGIPPLTQVLHTAHSKVADPSTGQTLDTSTDRSACYLCHPGSKTQCLRGAMGSATNNASGHTMSCQSCHGNLSQVGHPSRKGWLDEPNCQACHYDGKRKLTALDSNGGVRQVTDTRFATNPNTPSAGVSLFRFSTGHGGLQCEGCHGSTHAIFPSEKLSDNVYSKGLQGHEGVIAECTTCHETTPRTSTGGPHGIHSVGQYWVGAHEDVAKNNKAQCTACHGADYRGSPLSKVTVTRTFNAEDFGTKTFQAGHQVSCYDCHNGPSGGE